MTSIERIILLQNLKQKLMYFKYQELNLTNLLRLQIEIDLALKAEINEGK